nr:hypothetical protein [Tanacetum cinerariifolium]
MKQDKAKQIARDEKLVPTNDRVKIAKNNLRIDPFMTQMEETFQVALDFSKTFPSTTPFSFRLRKILDLTPNIENQDFIQPLSSDDLKEFLLNLSYTDILQIFHWLIPPKKIRGGAVKEDLPKETTKSKQKPSKQKQVLQAESSDSVREPGKVTQATKKPASPKKATTSSKKKIPRGKPPTIPVKQTYESSGKHKGIEILSDVSQFEINTLKAQKASRIESRLQHHIGGSDLSDNDDLNESEDDDDERVETDDDDERVETDDDDERVETNDDRDEEKEDDRTIDIKETDVESTESDDEHQGKGDVDMNIKQEVEKEMSDEKPKEDDITSMLDVPIQYDVSTVVLEPLYAVTVTVIPEATQAPPPPPPPTTVTLVTQVPNTEAVSFVVQRFSINGTICQAT